VSERPIDGHSSDFFDRYKQYLKDNGSNAEVLILEGGMNGWANDEATKALIDYDE
jgi:hypothetical protein